MQEGFTEASHGGFVSPSFSRDHRVFKDPLFCVSGLEEVRPGMCVGVGRGDGLAPTAMQLALCLHSSLNWIISVIMLPAHRLLQLLLPNAVPFQLLPSLAENK